MAKRVAAIAINHAKTLPTGVESIFLPGEKKVRAKSTTPVPVMMIVRKPRLSSPD
jgi:hypothetical protein